MSITRVQGNGSTIGHGLGTASGSTNWIPVTLNSIPQTGNVLIASVGVFSYDPNDFTVSSITQSGVTWAKQKANSFDYNSFFCDTEIWAGVVGSNASTSITVNLACSGGWEVSYFSVADICEYSGIASSSFLDQTALNSSTSATDTADTGTTAVTTQANELWIGAITSSSGSQSAQTNGFTLLDGAQISGVGSLAYLEKIVNSTGTGDCSTTTSTGAAWVGCIATFKAAAIATYTITASADSNSSISPSGNVVVNSGANQTFNVSANTGYHVTHVYVDSVDQGAVSSYTFTDVLANHTISVSSAINTYAITSSADANSSISPSGTTYVNYGANQSYTMSANTGYQIAHVYVDSVDQGAITAYTFSNVQATHTISVSSSAISNQVITGNLTVDGNATVNNTLYANSLSTIGNATIGNTLSAYSLSMLGNGIIYTNNLSPIAPQSNITVSGNLTAANLDANNNLWATWATINQRLQLPCNEPQLNNTQIMNETYGYSNGVWAPQQPTSGASYPSSPSVGQVFNNTTYGIFGQWNGSGWINIGLNTASQIPTGLGVINFYDNTTNNPNGNLNLFGIISSDNSDAPLLMTNQGFIAMKDIQAGGALFSSQGAVLLGGGFTTQVDYPRISLSMSTTNRLTGLTLVNGTWQQVYNLSAVPSYTSNPQNPLNGQIYINTENNHLYQYSSNSSSWTDMGASTLFNNCYDTLYLVGVDGVTPANLDLGNLTVHGNLNVNPQSMGFTIGNLYGTTNQINVTGGTGAIIGSGVTLSLPQNIDTSASPTFAGLTLSGSFSQTGGLSINSGGDILFYANNSPSNCQFKVASNGTSAFNLVWDITGNKSVLYVQRNSDGTDLVQTGSTILNDGYGNIRGIQNLYANAYCINTNFGNLYGNTITNNPAYNGTAYVWELAGTGLIIDGCLNVSQISMNAGTLVLDNGDNKAGYIQFGKTLSSTARLAQVTLNGQTLPVLAIQSYVGSGGKFGAWDLGVLDASMIFVDHLTSASGGGIYFFDSPRLNYGSGKYVYLYDCNNSAGSSGQVLCVNSSGYPQWSSSPSFGNISCGTLSCGAISIGGNIIPTSGGSYYCGSYSYPWQIVDTQYLYCNVINSLTSGITIYGSGGSCGTSSSYWNSVYGAYLYYINSPAHFNEALHDEFNDKINFDLIRNFRKDDKEGSKIHPDCIKHLRNKEGFYDTGTMDGWHLSVQKIMVQKFDEHDEKFEALMKRIELLENQLKQKQAA